MGTARESRFSPLIARTRSGSAHTHTLASAGAGGGCVPSSWACQVTESRGETRSGHAATPSTASTGTGLFFTCLSLLCTFVLPYESRFFFFFPPEHSFPRIHRPTRFQLTPKSPWRLPYHNTKLAAGLCVPPRAPSRFSP